MHIKTLCPRCESTYQVDSGLKGKRMRCPNPICRTIFEVRDVAESAAPPEHKPAPAAPVPTPLPARSGTVGEMVPILPSEAAAVEQQPAPHRKPPAPAKPASQSAPPEVVKITAEQPRALDEWFAGAAPVATGTSSQEAPEPAFFGSDYAPPVRPQATEAPPAPANDLGLAPLTKSDETPLARRTWRRPALVLLLLLLAAVGVTAWLLTIVGPGDEEPRFARAEKDYKERNFSEAADRFRALVQDFQDSDNRLKYQFYWELSELRNRVHRLHTGWEETAACIDAADNFLVLYKTEPLIEKHYDDLAETLYKLVEDTIYHAGVGKNRKLLEVADKLYAEAGRYRPAPPAQAEAIKQSKQKVSKNLEELDQRAGLLASLRKLESEPSAESLWLARQIAADAKVSEDAEVKEIVRKILTAHRDSIQFSTEWAADAVTQIVEEGPPSLLVLPFLGSPPLPALSAKERPVFAVVRGVLYAFDPASGRIRWVRRIGVDSQTLPVWLPPTPVAAEAVLVASSDLGGLLALEGRTGAVLWFLALPEICRGPPVVVGPRAYVACRQGLVFEIDTAGGRCLGGYKVDQQLTWQGVRQPGTDLLYFAADRFCVYAVDIALRRCVAVLYAGQASGALLCGPVVVPLLPSGAFDPAKSGAPRGQLLLSLAKGHAATEVLTYALPLTGPDQQPLPLLSLPGRFWFAPVQNGEQVTFISDAGALAIFGVKQPNNLDPDLFALFRTNVGAAFSHAARFGAQVVHADAGESWVLAQQRLYCFQANFDGKTGWNMEARHLGVGPLGMPLHDSQVRAHHDGGTTLYVVTEALDGSSCWMSAIDAQHGVPRWQRQLGWMCKGQPVAVGNHILGRDTNGLLLHFDAGKLFTLSGSDWRLSAKPVTSALKTTDDVSWLLRDRDGKTVVIVAVRGLEVHVSRFRDGSFSTALDYKLEAPPNGTAALVDDSVVLPLANERLCRLLPSGKVSVGKEWRSKQADAKAVGHVVAVGPGLLASTDGSRGITLWQIDGDDWHKLYSAQVASRIIAAPALVPLPGKPGDWALCVADTERGVTLLHRGGLRKLRHWPMSDNITAGPFVRGSTIGLVLGRRRLVLLDPNNDLPWWAHTFLHADIVGEPELVDGLLIVADVDGQFQAVDLATKQFVGLGYKLQASVAPAAAPVPLGDDRLFVPLTDGTVLLLSRDWFRPRILGFATVR